eukprot:3901196-Pyramimonas_sp.AAC.1
MAEWPDDKDFTGDPADFMENLTIRVPCYIKNSDMTLYTEVQATIIEAKVALDPIKEPRDPALPPMIRPRLPACGNYCLAFGQVPVGKRVVKPLTIRNVWTDEVMEVRMDCFDNTATFSMLSCRRALMPRGSEGGGDSDVYQIEFSPPGEGKFAAEMVLKTPAVPIVVYLTGEGLSPHMILEPETHELDMPDSTIHEPVSSAPL